MLASSSPRRRNMLASLGLSFRILTPRIDEDPEQDEAPADYVLRLACEKANEASSEIPRGRRASDCVYIVAADTVVVLDNRILGKPEDRDEAAAMLRDLSGRTHEVMTGLCVLRVTESTREVREKSKVVTTRVTFKTLSAAEIDAYIATDEPMDKAGAYGIQGYAAYMVSQIQGSYTNVVGLPLCEVIQMLSEDDHA